jgi:fructose-1,6-bisphosphatase/inositol monophosphatase family enzyme
MAAGRFDAAFGKNCKLWDIAGAACIIAEAGGVLVDHQGRSHFPFDVVRYEGGPTPFIAARPGLVQRFLADLAS